ncbi:hypothetical protein ACJX0J_030286, partial [Zea mays]
SAIFWAMLMHNHMTGSQGTHISLFHTQVKNDFCNLYDTRRLWHGSTLGGKNYFLLRVKKLVEMHAKEQENADLAQEETKSRITLDNQLVSQSEHTSSFKDHCDIYIHIISEQLHGWDALCATNFMFALIIDWFSIVFLTGGCYDFLWYFLHHKLGLYSC